MKSDSRAIRRRHKARMKRRAREVYPMAPKAEYWCDHLAVCNCFMCRNPRHTRKGEDRLTLQERKAHLRDRYGE